MKKTFILLLCLVLFPSLLIAQTPEERRGIEEDKREDLRPTEVRISDESKTEPPSKAPIDPIDIVYFAELIQKKVTFRYDACKALVVLMGVEDQYIGLDSQITFLKEKNLLPKKFESEFDPTQPLRKGLAAYMFCKALEIKGGLSLRIFGMSERYALRELAYQGIMPSGNVQDIVSGEELVSVLMQAANYLAQKQQVRTVNPEE